MASGGCNGLLPKLPKEQSRQAQPQPWWVGTTTTGRGRNLEQAAGDVLPELGDSAGQVGGVIQGVVGEAAVCVPGIPTVLPWQVLHRHKDSRVIIRAIAPKRNLLNQNPLIFFAKRNGQLHWIGMPL